MTELPKITDRYTADEITSFRQQGFWCDETPLSLLDHWAQHSPDTVFVGDDDGELSYAQTRRQALKVAHLLTNLGITKGDRILVQLPNWREFVAIALGITRVGGIVVPTLPIYRQAEIEHIVEHSGARVAFFPQEFKKFRYGQMYDQIQRGSTTLIQCISLRSSDSDSFAPDLETLLTDVADGPLATAPPSADDGHVIIYTSGTESRPKGCFHTYNTVAYSVRASVAVHGWTDRDIVFGPSPLSHSTGYLMSYLAPLHVGATSRVMQAWTPETGVEQIEKYRCTATTTATPFLRMSLDSLQRTPRDLSSMRMWIVAGSPVPEHTIREARKALPDCEILSHYGRSENQFTTTCAVGVDPKKVLASDGTSLPGTEIATVDDAGLPVPTGATGDIAYRGPGHMLGYFRDPERTAALFTADGFSRSGDLGFLDADGYVRVNGRLKDIIIRGGMNISAREIEDSLLDHPAVKDVAVVGMPDERLGEKVCAYIVPTGDARPTVDDIGRYLRSERRVAIQKLPERVELVESLPTTATGKIQKFVLRSDISRKIGAT